MCTVTSITNEIEKHGIFFRCPLQKREVDFYIGDKITFFESLLNRRLLKKAYEDSWDGILIRTIASPVYFTRKMRVSTHKFSCHPTIDKILSYGWEPYKNTCAGAAEKEITRIFFNDGTVTKLKKKESFHYTYEHVVKEEFCKE